MERDTKKNSILKYVVIALMIALVASIAIPGILTARRQS